MTRTVEILGAFATNLRRYQVLIWLLAWTVPMDLLAQQGAWEVNGLPFFHYYSPKSYHGEAQNWDIVQDSKGLLYVANTGGVLQYDGSKWQMIVIAEGASALSLAVKDSQQVFVGSTSDMGFLAPDSTGILRYVSLSPLIPEAHRNLHYVRQVQVVGDTVYFHDNNKLFAYDGHQITVMVSEKNLQQFSSVIQESLYLIEGEYGLSRVAQGRLHPVKGGKAFAGIKFAGMLPLSDGSWLVGSWSQGLFVFEQDSLRTFETELNDFLRKNTLYRMVSLADGSVALGTIEGGVVVMDEKGNWLTALGKEAGLPGGTVLGLFSDQQKNLWVGTNNGVVRFSYPSPFSRFGENEGVIGTVNSLRPYRNTILAGTSQGVYELKKGKTPEDPVYFENWPMVGLDIFDLLPVGDGVLVGDDAGLAWIREGKRQNLSRRLVQVLFRSQKDTSLVFVGFQDGMGYVYLKDGKIGEYRNIPGLEVEVRSLAEDKEGILWAGTLYAGIKKVDLSRGLELPVITHYGVADGLSHETDVEAFRVGEKVVFSTMRHLYHFDKENERFEPDSSLGKRYADGSHWVYRMAYQSDRRELWIHSYNQTETVCQKGDFENGFQLQESPFQRMGDFPVYAIFASPSGATWFGGPEGIVKYDPAKVSGLGSSFQCQIRTLTIGRDSVLFGGNGNGPPQNLFLPYALNSLRFDNTATFLESPESTLFQYWLEGFEEGWTSWTQENNRVYTNLGEGSYVFHVRARNLYGEMKEAPDFSFRIFPPWYRTWWFIGIAALAIVGVLTLGVRYLATRKLIMRVEELELREKVQKERERISRDLHDNVGSQLTLIINNLDVVAYKARKEDPEIISPAIDRIGETARSTMQELRETIWAIKQEHFLPDEFADRLRDYLRRYLSDLDTPLPWKVTVIGESEKLLGPSQVLNLFRIVQEATQNTVKYAQASNFGLFLDLSEPGFLLLTVQDDGKGMDLKEALGKKGHYGLLNMKRRISEIDGEIDIITEPGKGVRIEVRSSLGFSKTKQ